jgi:y4mF family transcriptional regulator
MKNIVYALESPIDGHVYYVGKSEKGLGRSYSHHRSHNKEVREWVLSLGDKEPVVRILERNLPDHELLPQERIWINKMVIRKEPILNKTIPTERQLKYSDYQVGKFVKEKRREFKYTQEEFAAKAGVGLRFIRDLEQGKEHLRMDKVLQVLYMFGATLVPVVR